MAAVDGYQNSKDQQSEKESTKSVPEKSAATATSGTTTTETTPKANSETQPEQKQPQSTKDEVAQQPEQKQDAAKQQPQQQQQQQDAKTEQSKESEGTSPDSGTDTANKQQGEGGGGGGDSKQQATAGIPGKDDERKLFVGGLTRNTTENELKEYFGKFGDIESVSIKMDPYTGVSRGFAFMVFQNPKAIDKLLASGDHYINKRKVDPKRVSKKAQHGKIFVGGLTPEITDEDIKNYFGQYGTIVEVQAPFDKTKNQRRSYCFVTFDSKDVVYKLLKTPKQNINGKEVDVKKVKVNQDQRQGFWGPQYGGYGYGGYGYIPDYNGYPNYDDVYNSYDYSGYGYESMYGIPGKPRPQGPRQFQRHQPY